MGGHLTLQLRYDDGNGENKQWRRGRGVAIKIVLKRTIKTTHTKQTAPLYHLELEAIYFPRLSPETPLLCSSPKG